MRMPIASCLLAFALIAAACTDLSGPHSTARRYVGHPPGHSMGYYVDWFDCYSSSYDGETWDCVYNHTDVNSGEPDYWDPYNNFYTTGDCSMVPQYCDTNFQPMGGGGSSPYTDPRDVARAGVADYAYLPMPTCPAPKSSSDYVKAFCLGHTPDATELGRLRSALTRMHQIGGVCDTLATIGDIVISRGALHIFPQASYDFGGAAPQGGGSNGPYSWVTLSGDWTKSLYDADHAGWLKNPNSGLSYRVTLQSALAHELDHLHDLPHTYENGVENLALTPHMNECSEIDIGPGVVRPH